jgi:signal transduction histidine kinase
MSEGPEPPGSEGATDPTAVRRADFGTIDDPALLRRVLEATLLLEANLDLASLLRRIVDEAKSMANARFAALGVLDTTHTGLAEFITSGIEKAQVDRIGPLPTGKGLLGLLISDPKPLRIARIEDHPERAGFPPNHPTMTSFLGVPIEVHDEVYGNLYLTDKIGWTEFTADDQALVEALALTAAVAIENARLHQRTQRAVVYEERDRLARDLHDTVIQRLFAVGLSLQSLAQAASEPTVEGGLQSAIADIDDTIRQIRTSIFELESKESDIGTRAAVLALVEELGDVVGFDVHLSFEGPIDAAVPALVAEHLLATAREAMTNVGRHAGATEAWVVVSVADGCCRLRVVDNGRGLAPERSGRSGHGLENMRHRAEKLDGCFEIDCPEGGGTVLTWQVPVAG